MKLKEVLRPANLIPVIAGFLFALILDVVKGYIAELEGPFLTAVLILGGIFGIVALWYRIQPKPTHATFDPPVTLRQPVDRLTYAREGLIVFVSLYRPQRHSPAAALRSEQWAEAAEAGDYETLDLPNSNLATAISSVVSHRHKLAHCWLIATTATDEEQVGSERYAPLLVKYLCEVEGMDCEFYLGETLAIPLDDDALVAVKTQKRVEGIFKQSDDLGLTDNDMVADFSGCPRSMALGMILACLDRNRDIQFVGTHYDEEARPTGDLFPVLFAFDTEVSEA